MDKNKCSSCGEAPHKCSCKNKEFTKAVIEINNPEKITLMRRVVIPTSMGDDTTVPPVVGKYHNVLLNYEANQKSYLYSSDGIPTQLVNGVTDYEAAVNLPQINGNTLIGDKTGDQLGLQDKLTAGDGIEIDGDNTISISDIEQYAHFFDTVADMKQATNFIDGSIAKTLGFYSAGDEGGAEYLIKSVDEADTVDDATIISISDQLNAHLIIKPEMNVKQFGCKGDDSTNDTTRFNIAIANSKKLIVNTGTYILSRFLPEEDQEVVGSKDAKIKVNGTTAPLVYFKSNSKITNLTIESVNEDLEWNRCDISSKSNITIENCSISGFRHDSLAPNAWGILISASSDINIVNCYFDNNSQSDIAVVQNTDKINIERCDGTALHINFEPNNGDPIKNVTISNCNIERLNLLENDYTKTSVRNAFVYACTINKIRYDGASVTFEDCRINSIEPDITGGFAYGGNLRLINSANFSKNLINDPYLDTLKSNGTEWLLNFASLGWTSVVSASDDSDGRCVVLNQNNSSTQISIKHSPFTVNAGDTYMVRLNSKEVTVASGGGYVSCNMTIKYLDNDNQEVSNVRYSVNRHPTSNSDSGMGEISCILKVPDGATKMVIILLNSSYGTQSLYIRSIELYKINANTYNSNNLETLPVRKTRVFNASAQPSGSCIPFAVGDRLYYNDPSSNLGAVCTVAGTPGTWRNF